MQICRQIEVKQEEYHGKSLFEKLKNGTCDEIDRDMIAARVKVVHEELLSSLKDLGKVSQRIGQICEEYKEEAYILGFRLIIAAADDISNYIFDVPKEERNDMLYQSIFGARKDVQALLKAVKDIIDHKL